jgi:hypothetical protein
MVRALAALSANHCATDVVVVVATVAVARFIAADGAPFAVTLASVGSDLAPLVTVPVLLLGGLAPDHFSRVLLIPHDHDSGILAGDDDGSRRRRFLDNDLLGLRSTLADDDGRRGRVGLGVVFGFLAVALNFDAMRVLVALLDALLDTDLVGVVAVVVMVVVVVSGTLVPVTIGIPWLVDRDARTIFSWVLVALIVHAPAGVGFKSRARSIRGGGATIELEQLAGRAAAVSRPRLLVNLDDAAVIAARIYLVAADGGALVAVLIVGALVAVDAGLAVDVGHGSVQLDDLPRDGSNSWCLCLYCETGAYPEREKKKIRFE